MSEKDDYVKIEIPLKSSMLRPWEPSEELKEKFAQQLRPLIGDEFVTTHLEFTERNGEVYGIRLELAPALSDGGNRGGAK